MNKGNELPANLYSGGPVANESPKRFEDSWRTVFYALYIVATVAIMQSAPQPARIVAIAAWLLSWAMFNTWKKDKPALAGGWVSFFMFVITVIASWISSGTMQSSHLLKVRTLQVHFRSIERSVNDHHQSHGSYPKSLTDPIFASPDGRDSSYFRDPWNRPILCNVDGDGFRLSSFGRDGVPGGIGLDSDWLYRSSDADLSPFSNTPDVRLPLWQFLYDTPSTSGILVSAVLLCMTLGRTVRSESEKSAASKRTTVITAIAVTVIGAAVCTFLAMFHIAASQSSH